MLYALGEAGAAGETGAPRTTTDQGARKDRVLAVIYGRQRDDANAVGRESAAELARQQVRAVGAEANTSLFRPLECDGPHVLAVGADTHTLVFGKIKCPSGLEPVDWDTGLCVTAVSKVEPAAAAGAVEPAASISEVEPGGGDAGAAGGGVSAELRPA